MRSVLRVAVLAALAAVGVQAGNGNGNHGNGNGNGGDLHFPTLPTISYVSFKQALPAGSSATPLTIAGVLTVPKTATAAAPVPAVLIAHGSGGIDSRGQFYRAPLNELGYATLEIDMWAARGWYGGGTSGRPRAVQETIPDAYGALNFLASLPTVNASAIGILGFSWGGLVSILSATPSNVAVFGTAHKFVSHAAHYPVCWAYTSNIPTYKVTETDGSPILIQTGDLDDYNAPSACSNWIATLPAAQQSTVHLIAYADSTHGFDRLEPAMTVTDPYAHYGAGGSVQFTPNLRTATQANEKVQQFFQATLRA